MNFSAKYYSHTNEPLETGILGFLGAYFQKLPPELVSLHLLNIKKWLLW